MLANTPDRSWLLNRFNLKSFYSTQDSDSLIFLLGLQQMNKKTLFIYLYVWLHERTYRTIQNHVHVNVTWLVLPSLHPSIPPTHTTSWTVLKVSYMSRSLGFAIGHFIKSTHWLLIKLCANYFIVITITNFLAVYNLYSWRASYWIGSHDT
jgi:hypothetical protein